MDIPSPFYLHPFENVGSSLLPGVFDGTGYRSWRRAVLRALSVKSKTGFINGKFVKPNPDDPSFQQWERCDDMVTFWILNSLSPDLRDSLQYVNNAQELWAELEEMYDQTNGCKLYQLQNEINDLVQGTLDVTGYYTKMKKLWEEMSNVDVSSQCSCVCTCGGKTKRTCHTRERFYKLYGYPSNSKVSKGKSVVPATNMCTSENDGNQCEQDPELRKQMPLNLSKDQYEQLLNLLGSLQAGTTNSDNMLSGAVNLADSGASHHMTYNKTTLTNIRPLSYPFLISLPNGYKVKVTEIGDFCHTPSLHLGQDRHSETIAGPKRTLGLAFLTQRKPTQ
ncbi:hypothetical protein KY285_019899 [Solanum tuberosum]|nr:hypothetical protein KY289_020117 [Solanum tuberosum]KAH0692802.1 hypothetical protein KY285_019899 [Solanum tuberosum]